MYALNGESSTQMYEQVVIMRIIATIAQLQIRKQHFKLRMFKRLRQVLILVVVVIVIFFIVSSLVFSGRLAEGTITPTMPKTDNN